MRIGRQKSIMDRAHDYVESVAETVIPQLEAALDSRTVIAQACGMVMERFDIDAVQAFALLTRLSSTQNVKLRDIATGLVRTRLLPARST